MSAVDFAPPIIDCGSARFSSPPFRVRLVYQGANDRNASGESDKYWQLTARRDGTAEVRWGRTGSRGQAQVTPLHEAVARASRKLGKGYCDDAAARGAQGAAEQRRTAPRAQPADQVPLSHRASQAARDGRLVDLDGLLDLVAQHGLVPLADHADLGVDIAPLGVQSLIVYLDRRREIVAVARYPDGSYRVGRVSS